LHKITTIFYILLVHNAKATVRSFDVLSKDSGIVMTGKNQLHKQYPLKLVHKTKITFVVIVVTWYVVVI